MPGNGGVNKREMAPGRRYRIEFGDCCVAGSFTATYVGPVADPDDPEYVTGHRFDIGEMSGAFNAEPVGGGAGTTELAAHGLRRTEGNGESKMTAVHEHDADEECRPLSRAALVGLLAGFRENDVFVEVTDAQNNSGPRAAIVGARYSPASDTIEIVGCRDYR